MIVKPQSYIYKIVATNTIEQIGLDKPRAVFRKIAIFGGLPDVSTGLLTANANDVYIGMRVDGHKVLPFKLPASSADVPVIYELPANRDEQMLLMNFLCRGTQNEGIYCEYWP